MPENVSIDLCLDEEDDLPPTPPPESDEETIAERVKLNPQKRKIEGRNRIKNLDTKKTIDYQYY